jgi:hypothetical protein
MNDESEWIWKEGMKEIFGNHRYSEIPILGFSI